MPIIKSAKKALRQAKSREARNRKWKDAIRTAVKTVQKTVAAKKTEEAKKALSSAYKTIDKAAKKHILQKNRASRMKSRLAKSIK
jgi:small subunit ribosomal protein S20